MMTSASGTLFVPNGKYFCAPDYDVDQYSGVNFAADSYAYGGWWLGYYSVAVLNRNAGGRWENAWTATSDVQTSRMLVKSN